MTEKTTHFGYRKIPAEEKAEKVAQVFNSVADRYDLMNDAMSLGIHRLWKRCAVELSAVRKGQRILDLAADTGDLTRLLARRVGQRGLVVSSDINGAMLQTGRARLVDRGIVGNVCYVQADAERLPFPDNHFDRVTIAFGLRNVTRKEEALTAMLRVLKPGGRLTILEFSRLAIGPLRPLYDLYSFTVVPGLGRLITGDAESYRYLVESIRVHPDQRRLEEMMRAAGFAACDHINLTGGIVAIHRGAKL